MPKICELTGVREYGDGDPVELWRDDANGRLTILAYNECGNNSTSVDLWDLVAKLSEWGNINIDMSTIGNSAAVASLDKDTPTDFSRYWTVPIHRRGP